MFSEQCHAGLTILGTFSCTPESIFKSLALADQQLRPFIFMRDVYDIHDD